MAGLFSILSNASSSLQAHRTAASVAGNNLANANTPGYTRQTAVLQELSPSTPVGNQLLGRGVGVAQITQTRDPLIERQMPAALAAEARSSAESTVLNGVSALDPEAGGGIASALGAFYSAMNAVAQNAGDSGLRQAAVAAADTLARSFRTTAAALDDARAGAQAAISGEVPQINSDLASLADLNRRIREAQAGGGQPNELLDQRRNVLDRLAESVGGVQVPNTNGDINLTLADGTALVVGDRAAALSALSDDSALVVLRLAPADGSPPRDVSASAVGGRLGGLIDAAGPNGAIAGAQSSLDAFAKDLSTMINQVHAGGYDLNGVSGRALFSAGGDDSTAGFAGRMVVDAAVLGDPRLLAASATGAPGDGANMTALVATRTTPPAGYARPDTRLAEITTTFGNAAARATSAAEQDATFSQHLGTLRDSTSGVSIDEELVKLTQAERAFQAISKVITTADNMLQTLLSIR